MTAKITAALHAVMSEVGYVQKTGRNEFHKYNYAGEADLLDKLRPAMLKHGLLLIPSVTDVTAVDDHGNTTVRMEYTLAHKDGDIWPEKIGAAGTGNDRNSKGGVGDKGTYKAITGANKYLLFKLFQIETGDDPESASAADDAPARPTIPARDAAAYVAEAKDKIAGFTDADALFAWWSAEVKTMNETWMPRPLFEELKSITTARRQELVKGARVAA